MRLLSGTVAALLVVGLSACSASGPGDSASAPAGPSGGDAAPASSAPSGTGDLPAPLQREPVAVAAAAPPGGLSLHADPGALDVVVNKRRPLEPLDFAPTGLRRPAVAASAENALLRPDTAAAVEAMFAAAADEGVGLVLVSGYRSFADQASTYAHWVGQYGGAEGADAVSARPGFSEHQTGLALDIAQSDGACTLVLCFRDTTAARWAATNAAEFGFILRYPLGSHEITGFSAESWHFRYVGTEVSRAMKAAGTQTLEEYYGIPAAPSY